MNTAALIGRLTKDIELKYLSGDDPVAVANFSIAVDRPKKRGQEKPDVDFIPIAVFGRPAENCEKYLSKGMKVAILGRIQVDRTEDKQGNTRIYTKVVANNVEFIDYRQKDDASAPQRATEPPQDDVPDSFQMINEEVPFN